MIIYFLLKGLLINLFSDLYYDGVVESLTAITSKSQNLPVVKLCLFLSFF